MDKLWVQIALWAVAGVNGLGVLWLAASWVAARRDDWKRGIRRAQRREDTARGAPHAGLRTPRHEGEAGRMTDSPQPDRETAMHEIAEKLIALLDEAARRGVFIDKDGVTGCVEAPIGGEWVRMDLRQGYGVCYPQETCLLAGTSRRPLVAAAHPAPRPTCGSSRESDDDSDEWEEHVIFVGCTCKHDPDEHGWGECDVEGCPCEGGWEESERADRRQQDRRRTRQSRADRLQDGVRTRQSAGATPSRRPDTWSRRATTTPTGSTWSGSTTGSRTAQAGVTPLRPRAARALLERRLHGRGARSMRPGRRIRDPRLHARDIPAHRKGSDGRCRVPSPPSTTRRSVPSERTLRLTGPRWRRHGPGSSRRR